MPGRSGSLINGEWTEGGNAVLAHLTVDERSGNQPVEYVASGSIEFLPGSESGDGDAFVAYIDPEATSGSGGEGSGLYRYGFNGKENDNEVKGEGNQQDYGMRIYDGRLGRFLSVDPLASSYPWYTPYQFAGNIPITFIDRDGLEPAEPGSKVGETVTGTNGNNPAKSWIWNGSKWDDNSSLEEVVVKGKIHKRLELSAQNSSIATNLPYGEISEIALDITSSNLEKIYRLNNGLGKDVLSQRSVDAAFLRSYIAKNTLKILDKAFSSIQFVNIGMSRSEESGGSLSIPFIGGATELIMEDYTKSLDHFVLETSMQKGYVPFARALNSSAGVRSGLMGVYVTKDIMISILQGGGINSKIHNLVGFSEYPDNPIRPDGKKYDYFLFFPKKSEGTIKNFGVLPIE